MMLQTRRTTLTSALGWASLAVASAQNRPEKVIASAPAAPAGTSQTDIFEAAYKGDVPRATELAGQNPAIAQLRSADGRTPLHYAVEGGHPGMVMFLLMQGADLSAGPVSPLLSAVDLSDHTKASEMSKVLLGNGSDANARRKDGKSALALAMARGYHDIVEELVHRGATGPQADGIEVERVYFGQRYSFDLKGRPYTAENIDGLPQPFINEFVRLAHFDAPRVQHLLQIAGGLIGARATWDELAIEAAAHMGLAPLATHLAEHGAPVSICTATLLGMEDRVAALVKSDAKCVRERGPHDIALMAYTAYAGEHAEIADFLLRSGASVDAPGMGGFTALHLAAKKGYVQLAEVLIARGANVNASAAGKPDVRPVPVAIQAKQEKMADFLKSRGGR